MFETLRIDADEVSVFGRGSWRSFIDGLGVELISILSRGASPDLDLSSCL